MRVRIIAVSMTLAFGWALASIVVTLRPGASHIAFGTAFGAASGAESTPTVGDVYLRDCATCHGADARGTSDGPDLHGTGAAQVDFQLATGRMPVPTGDASEHRARASSGVAQERRAPRYDAATRRQLVEYVVALAGGGGAEIPDLRAGEGDVAAGGTLFRLQCAACHAWSGDGGALLQREAPSTHPATSLEIAEAVRAGPGNMPAFGRAAVSDTQLESLVRYVRYLDHPDDRGGAPLGHVGPLAEGALAVFVGLGLLVVAVRWIGTRS